MGLMGRWRKRKRESPICTWYSVDRAANEPSQPGQGPSRDLLWDYVTSKGEDEAGKREDVERGHVKTLLHSEECCAALSPPGPSTETRIYQIMAEIMRAVTSSTHHHTAILQHSIDIDLPCCHIFHTALCVRCFNFNLFIPMCDAFVSSLNIVKHGLHPTCLPQIRGTWRLTTQWMVFSFQRNSHLANINFYETCLVWGGVEKRSQSGPWHWREVESGK